MALVSNSRWYFEPLNVPGNSFDSSAHCSNRISILEENFENCLILQMRKQFLRVIGLPKTTQLCEY